MKDDALVREQIEYYRARADEYDEWFERRGRYDRGPEHRVAWLSEVALVETALKSALPAGNVLELACGTGLWTRHLVQNHRRVVAVDASPEVIAVNRARVNSERVTYIVADVFTWLPPQRFDAVFFGFWLSHVPEELFDAFWKMVATALTPGGTVFFVDSLLEQESTAVNHEPLDRSGVVRRRLNDGREFRIVKLFHDPTVPERRLHGFGWKGQVRPSGRFFLYGSLTSA